MTGAELLDSSVHGNLPDSDAGVTFIVEVALGNRLFLRAPDGADVQNHLLSGSRALIDALGACGHGITSPTPGNPFN